MLLRICGRIIETSATSRRMRKISQKSTEMMRANFFPSLFLLFLYSFPANGRNSLFSSVFSIGESR